MTRGGRRYSSELKFQVVLESLRSDLTPGQIAKQNGVHPNSVGLWKKTFLTGTRPGPSGSRWWR